MVVRVAYRPAVPLRRIDVPILQDSRSRMTQPLDSDAEEVAA
jgi:hypothetical protein